MKKKVETKQGPLFPLAGADTLFRSIVETIREPLLLLDHEQRVVLANHAFYATFRAVPAETEKKRIYDLGNRQWNISKLRVLLEEILPKNSAFSDFAVEHEFPIIGKRFMLLNARRLVDGRFILLTIEDVTMRMRLQELIENEKDQAFKSRDELIAVVSHEIKNPLTAIGTSLHLIQKGLPGTDCAGAFQRGGKCHQVHE